MALLAIWVAWKSLTGEYLIGAVALFSVVNLVSVLVGSVYQRRRWLNEHIQVAMTFATPVALFWYYLLKP